MAKKKDKRPTTVEEVIEQHQTGDYGCIAGIITLRSGKIAKYSFASIGQNATPEEVEKALADWSAGLLISVKMELEELEPKPTCQHIHRTEKQVLDIKFWECQDCGYQEKI